MAEEWVEYGKTYREMEDENLANAGVMIEVGKHKYLIGNINRNGGVCDCCEGVKREDVVIRYWVVIEEDW